MTRKLISAERATQAKGQHKTPCSDCPWRRDALPGWTGLVSPEEWVAHAHGEAVAECHTLKGAQCAGMAVYRGNVCKTPRDPATMKLPPDRETVFSNPQEFLTHHKLKERK